MRLILFGIFVAFFAAAFGAWLVCAISMVLALRNRKPGLDLWRDAPWGNPWNLLLDASNLTDRGLQHRRRALIAVLIFVVCVATPLLGRAFSAVLKR